jgi:hypothetical protein
MAAKFIYTLDNRLINLNNISNISPVFEPDGGWSIVAYSLQDETHTLFSGQNYPWDSKNNDVLDYINQNKSDENLIMTDACMYALVECMNDDQIGNTVIEWTSIACAAEDIIRKDNSL